MIHHSRPTIGAEDFQAVTEVLQSGNLAQGANVRQFEDAVAAYLDRRGAVATNSGTSALHLALLGLGVGPGDEVLLPSYTCVALLHAVRCAGATPHLVDIAPDEYNMCPDKARRHVTSRAKAIIVPHMFGMPADLGQLGALGIPIIEDCAQALGAAYRDRRAGSTGIITVCSFYATKVITTGEGGMLLSDSEALLQRARDLRDYNAPPTAQEPHFNYKMTDIQAALGLSQLRRLPAFLARRRDLAMRYGCAFRDLPVRLPIVKPEGAHIFYRYVIGVPDAPHLAHSLTQRGIECKPPVAHALHSLLEQDGCPETERAMRTALSIPLYPSLTDEDMETVIGAVTTEVAQREDLSRLALSLRR